MRVKKRKKATRFRGTHTHGRGFKKKARGSGHRGGVGMSGTGKRADQKKTLVLNLYGNDYFGKQKALRKGVIPIRLEAINLSQVIQQIEHLEKKGLAKEVKGVYEITLKGYKILGDGEVTKKLKIIASAASASASEKVKKAGGEIVLAE